MNEHQIYEHIASYLQLRYPEVIYRFDLAADLKLTPGQARKHKKLHPYRGYPDLVILEPTKEYHGLFVEIKKEGTRIYKKNGSYASEHLIEQARVLHNLQERGYAATFAVGLDETKQIIDDYLKV